jgi:predicted XRE-type DNA-binding protein
MRDVDPIPALKSQLAAELVARLDGWRQDYAGAFIGTTAARVSNLRNGRLDPFSLERLIRFIARDAGDVTLTVTWRSRWEKLRDQRSRRLAASVTSGRSSPGAAAQLPTDPLPSLARVDRTDQDAQREPGRDSEDRPSN